MGFFKKLMLLREALNYGEQLSNRETWKKSGIAATTKTLGIKN